MSHLVSSKQLKEESIKLMKDGWSAAMWWVVGVFIARLIFQFGVIGVSSAPRQLSVLATRLTGGGVLLALVTFVLVMGLIRVLLQKAIPDAKIASYLNSLLVVFVAGIVNVVLVGVGFLLLILPGIWLGTMFTFYTMEVIANDKGVWTSLKGSYGLVKGRWWAVFGRIAMAALWAILLSIGLIIVVWVIGLIPGLPVVVRNTIDQILTAGLAAFVLYFVISWQVLLYRSVRMTASAHEQTKKAG